LLYVYPMSKMNYPEKELKQAYTIVAEHLTQALLKAKVGEPVRCGTLGSFKKTENQITSYLQNEEGRQYVYYRLLFKPFSKLKQSLNQALEKKYNR